MSVCLPFVVVVVVVVVVVAFVLSVVVLKTKLCMLQQILK